MTGETPVSAVPPVPLRHGPASFQFPPGRVIDLPGRGRTFARVVDPPPGAPTLLLLHGWTVTADLNWFTSYEALAQRFGLVALDHRGHGRGIRSKGSFRLEDCADDAAALVDQLGIERVIPVGYSMGGTVAQLMWRRHHRLVDGLVLCATAASFNASTRERLLFATAGSVATATRLMPERLRHRLGLRLLTGEAGSEVRRWARGEMARHDWLQLVRAARRIGSFDSRRWISTIDVAVSVVITTTDAVVGTQRQRALAAAIPGCATFDVDGPHNACVTRASEFVPALEQAIDAVSDRLNPV